MTGVSLSFNLLTALCIFSFFPISNAQSVETKALLQFKRQLNDPMNYLESWKYPQSACQFFGVTCDSNSGEVIGISLAKLNLSGEISPSISVLHSLTSLMIGENSMSGNVPYELVNCTKVQVLNLSSNSLTGQLPDLSSLSSLQVLDLSSNDFSGEFPAWISNLSGLTELGVAHNNFNEGEIPQNIGKLKNLTWLFLAECNLRGEIPASIFELTSLGTLDLSQNKLVGKFPIEISNLHMLFKIELYQNNLTGEIPPQLVNLTNLQDFDISHNQMTGKLPTEIGNLKNLRVIHLFHNYFWGELPKGFGDLQFLEAFSIYENNFSGEFPPNLGRYSPFNSLDISENNFSGNFPKFLCQNHNLQFLLALDNNFSGEFPDTYSNCKSLQRFRINQNHFTGRVPDGLWGLPFATIIDLSDNGFTGGISSMVGLSISLNQLSVQNNEFSGEIPMELGKLSQLRKLYASNNSFSGCIPSQIGQLNQLTFLHLEMNLLTGQIPSELGMCTGLVDINFSQNSLSGIIPETLSSLASLNSLNLSQNLISGLIPGALQSLKLSCIDFSNNQLTGSVPPGLMIIAGKKAFMGNPRLCTDQRIHCLGNRRKYIFEKRLVFPIILSAMILLLVGLVLVSYRSFKSQEAHKSKDQEEGRGNDSKWKLESFYPTELDAEEICDLEEENLIGSGGTGKVYRLDLKGRGTVAVKKFWKGNGAKVLMSEMHILGKIRHKNILKLYAALSKEESYFLVFEYMANGNLYHVLHKENKGGKHELNWYCRYKIALGAAKGIMYLHHDCWPAIIHRDIKSSNILLDEEYEAKIADFGIARIAEESELSCLAGTHGYMAPELAYSLKVTEKSDVYSFGIVLLELLTGRSPIEPQFGEGKDIVYWVLTHLYGQKVTGVLDPRVSGPSEDDMIKVLKIAVLCTTKLPSLRPSMREVVKMLVDADPCNVVTRTRSYGKNC